MQFIFLAFNLESYKYFTKNKTERNKNTFLKLYFLIEG